MSSYLQAATRAARLGGKILVEKFEAARDIRSKGKRDIVTDADYASERAVRQVLQEHDPQTRFISEELTAEENAALWRELDANPGLCGWVVDPLDGTTNYAHRQPLFAVSIALYSAGQVQVGVVLDPLRKELFAAERGRGATLNSKPIAVSTTARFDDAVLGMEWGRGHAVRVRSAKLLQRMVTRCFTARSSGSAALSVCYLAAGRIDAYFHLSLAPWDIAAAALIAEEAGGRVTDASGVPWTVHSRSYVGTNKHLHPAMLRFFRS